MSIYITLTEQFNAGRLRAVLGGGQAVVLHNLAIMSKDGDWILLEDEEVCVHVRSVLAGYGARYRFGAPLDIRWLAGGWSAHFEFMYEGIRVRTDFVTRPPRLDADALERLWSGASSSSPVPHAQPKELADMKKTDREKDYAVIGELARLMEDPVDQFIYSRSARDLMELAKCHADLLPSLIKRRAVLKVVSRGRDALEAALDAERREMMRANERRLERYMQAAQPWADAWPETQAGMTGLSLDKAHEIMVKSAQTRLPFNLKNNPEPRT